MNPSTSTSTSTTTIDASALRASLAPLIPILDAFNHRHKNQHRASHWWSHFNILRRAVKSLVSCPSRQDALLPRVRWMKDHIVPKTYGPFTQLIADQQFAPLGVLLVGVLARVNTVLVETLPPETTAPPTALVESTAATSLESKADRGVTVSRGDYTQPKPSQASKSPVPDDTADAPVASRHDPALLEKKKKKGKKHAVDDEALAPPKKKKKKIKAKGGDDFSSMFGSL